MIPLKTIYQFLGNKGIKMQKIIFENKDKTIGVITPSEEALSFATIKQIAKKDVPANLPYWIVNESIIPSDRTFRSAWEINDSMGKPDGVGGDSYEFDKMSTAQQTGGLNVN